MTLTEVFRSIPATAEIQDANGEAFVAGDIDTTETEGDFIRDGDDVIRMTTDGFRAETVYRVVQPHTFEIAGEPRVESEESDDYSTVMVFDLRRDDGVVGDVWIVAGVPPSLRGSSDAAHTQYGYTDVWVYGGDVDHWCPREFQAEWQEDYYDLARQIEAVCREKALAVHRAEMGKR